MVKETLAMERKPIQIVKDNTGLYALCDDGTIWYYKSIQIALSVGEDIDDIEWIPIQGVPQPKKEEQGAPFDANCSVCGHPLDHKFICSNDSCYRSE
jgi:hypothetical protein